MARDATSVNQGTINLPSYFGTGGYPAGADGVFNIGDGVLTNGQRDAIVNVEGEWAFDRHDNGTFTINIFRDGALYGGTFRGVYGRGDDRLRTYVINVDGGLMVSPDRWTVGPQAPHLNRVNISNRGSITVGSVTIHDNVIDFLDRTASFTAGFGGSFANMSAVEAALGSNFVSSTGPAPMAIDNRDGTFTVGGLLPPTGGTLPGGFAVNAPGSGLLYHLDAALGVSTDGTAVTGWADQGHAENSFAQADANKQPELRGDFGGKNLPALRFDGDRTSYDTPDQLVLDTSTQPRTIVIVNSLLSRLNNGGIIGRTTGGEHGIRQRGEGWRYQAHNVQLDFAGPEGSEMFVNGLAAVGDVAPVDGTAPHILTATRSESITYAQTGLGDYFVHSTMDPRPFHGDIAEVLVFDRVLNGAELRILENHLSAKYAIPLAENNLYAGDDPSNGGYDIGVFGIGRIDADNVVSRAGADGLGVASWTLEDDNWLLAGHKSATNDWVSDDLPRDGRARWDRVWYLDPTGDFDVTLAFDHADGGLLAPDPTEPLGLFYSPTNAFDFSIVAQNPEVYDGLVLFDLSAGQLHGGYYTLGIIPEPGTMVMALLGLAFLLMRRRRK